MTVLDHLEIEVNFELDKLGKEIALGSDEHRKVTGDVAQLADRYIKLKEDETERERLNIEREKLEIERAKIDAAKTERIEIEQEKLDVERDKIQVERERVAEDKKGRFVQNILTAAGIIIPAGITITGMVLMFIFEENGTITSGAGRKVVERIFGKK
jgi:hypothetical protein